MQNIWQKPHVLTLSVATLAALFSLAHVAWQFENTTSNPSPYPYAVTLQQTPNLPLPASSVASAPTLVSTPPASAPLVPAPAMQQQAAAAPSSSASAPVSPVAAAPALTQPPSPPPTVLRQVFEMDRGDTLVSLLTGANVVNNEAKAAMNAIRKVFDLKRLRQGQNVTLTTRREAGGARLLELAFRPEATTEVTLQRTGDGAFKAQAKAIPTTVRRMAGTAVIDSNLFTAGQQAGIPPQVMKDFFKLLSYQVDFQRDLHSGDRFHILYDQTVTSDNVPVGQGKIIFAALESGSAIRELYLYKFKDGSTDYFTARGESIRRGLLRTPVDGAHITSGFGMRMHPILGYSKMHKGVDFGAPIGSPIFAAGDGLVEVEGWENGYGRYMKIRHNATLETAYAHMNGFAANVHKGDRVRQGQVIGYVGMTGRATGPHLHYETIIDGVQVNPMGVNVPTAIMLSGKDLENFRRQENSMLDDYQRILKQASIGPGPDQPKVATR